MLIFLLPVTFAETTGVVSKTCASTSAYDYAGITECQLDSYAMSGNKLFADQMQSLEEEVYDSVKAQNFDLLKTVKYFGIFQYLFFGLLVLITILIGYQFMVSADNPQKREECKRSFKFIIFSGVLLVALPLIIVETYNFSDALNAMVMSNSNIPSDLTSFKNMFPTFDSSKAGLEGSVEKLSKLYVNVPLFATIAKAYILSMNARNLLLLFLISTSPIILLLFISSLTREYGKLMIYLFALELIYPVACILTIHFSLVLSGVPVKMMILSSALMLSVAFHIILILATIIKASVTVVNQIRLQEVDK
jgi:hypothetical protein